MTNRSSIVSLAARSASVMRVLAARVPPPPPPDFQDYGRIGGAR